MKYLGFYSFLDSCLIKSLIPRYEDSRTAKVEYFFKKMQIKFSEIQSKNDEKWIFSAMIFRPA